MKRQSQIEFRSHFAAAPFVFIGAIYFPGWRRLRSFLSDLQPPGIPWPFARCAAGSDGLTVTARGRLIGRLFVLWVPTEIRQIHLLDKSNSLRWEWSEFTSAIFSKREIALIDRNGTVVIQVASTAEHDITHLSAMVRDVGITTRRVSWLETDRTLFRRR